MVLLLPAALLSCNYIDDNLDNCPVKLEVRFTYGTATYARTGVNEAEVDKIDVFVFDAQGIFRGVWTDDNPTLSPAYFMEINSLMAGDYRFIAWCGLRGNYKTSPAAFTVGQTTFEQALLVLERNGSVDGGVAPLFHAQKSESISGPGRQTVYLPLVQAYNTINLTTEGLQNNTDTYRMTIYDNNGKYNFDYSFANDDEFGCTTLCGKDAAGQLQSALRILKLAADRSPVFEIINETQGTTLYRENLVWLINETGSVNYNETHTYDIHLKFSGLGISIGINGWWVVEDGQIGLN
jgi:hypothetical protein